MTTTTTKPRPTSQDVFALINESVDVERDAANSATRLPEGLGIARRRLRAALLRAHAPDADALIATLNRRKAGMIESGQASIAARAGRDAAVASRAAPVPDSLTPDIISAYDTLRAKVGQCRAIVTPSATLPAPRPYRPAQA